MNAIRLKKMSRFLKFNAFNQINIFNTKKKNLTTLAFCVVVFLMYYFGLLVHLLEVDYDRFSYPLDIPVDEAINAMKKGLIPPYQPINEYNYRFRIENSNKCQRGIEKNYEEVVILYVIKSALNHKHRRDALRKSWGRENRFSDVLIKRIFVMGMSEDGHLQDDIDEEFAQNKDLIQAEFRDNYYNSTVKTMMAFKWVMKNCPGAQFILFADDDMYISTKNLLKFIRSSCNRKHAPSNKLTSLSNVQSLSCAFDGRLMAGFVTFVSPVRDQSSKWYVSLAEYPYSKYPSFIPAGAYVLTFQSLEDLYYGSMFTRHFKFDDVYLGIVAKKCGISRLHNENFYIWKKPYSKECYVDVISSHGYDDPEELLRVWNEQRTLGHA